MSTRWLQPLEQACQGAGHWHIEGRCAFRMGRTWAVTLIGCQAGTSADPNELPVYRSSLAMVRDYIRTQIHNAP